MPRPVKWSRDLHPIRDRALRSKTETWSRKDIEHLFGIGPSSAQTLMKAIGEVQTVGGTHFVDRPSLLSFLDEMVQGASVEEALRLRLERSAPVPRPAPLRIALASDLRRITLTDLPNNVEVREGEVRITGASAERIVEGLTLLATAMQNDFDNVMNRLDSPPLPSENLEVDESLREMLRSLRRPAPSDAQELSNVPTSFPNPSPTV